MIQYPKHNASLAQKPEKRRRRQQKLPNGAIALYVFSSFDIIPDVLHVIGVVDEVVLLY